MTAAQAAHLIEQFAAQAPFAVCTTDSRGILIFANRKMYEMFSIPGHPSEALGLNLFDNPTVTALGLEDLVRKARSGETIDTTLSIPRSANAHASTEMGETLTIRVNCYALRSSMQKIEHYVVLLSDITEASHQREEMKTQMRDLAIYNKSKGARLSWLHELEGEVKLLEKQIRDLGVEPVA